jgi:predicted nucleic acid-binding protein
MKAYVLDTKSILAFLGNDPGADFVEELLWKAVQEQRRLGLAVTSWGEVLTAIWTSQGQRFAEEVQTRLQQLPIDLVPIDASLSRAAVALSVKLRIPYLDCVAIAIAQQRKAILVTTDRHLADSQPGLRVQIAA